MTVKASNSQRRAMLYAILGGIIAATIPFYCTATLLIALRPTPVKESTPTHTPAAIPSRQFPLPASFTPSGTPQATPTLTHTAFIPPTPTESATPTETPTPAPPTHTRTATPTDTPLPTATSTPVPSDTPSTP